MKIGLLQLNFTVGDLLGNSAKIVEAAKAAEQKGADLCITSEMGLMGYPPRDMLLDTTFVNKSWEIMTRMAGTLSGGPDLLVGVAEPNRSNSGRPLYNAAAFLSEGQIKRTFRKALLPTYDVFDEDRYFEAFFGTNLLDLDSIRIGVTICEDIWNDNIFSSDRRYYDDPVQRLTAAGADCIVNLSSSPFTIGKHLVRESILRNITQKYRVPVIYVNQVGGNDDLVFDGRSCVFDAQGRPIARAKAFEEDVLVVDLSLGCGPVAADDLLPEAEAWHALVCGTRDYIRKCGFQKALLGLSGGIDSALTLTIAVEALCKENVIGVLMPSPYSSRGSIDDSLKLAQNLGIQTLTLPIKETMAAFNHTLSDVFAGHPADITEENIQARIRGNLLMALSNKFNALLLTTGNKSELAVGYCTIYGDMSGGLAVIADVPKTMVYRVSRWVNKEKQGVIPWEIIDKAPSAELRPNQTDQDSLPPYDTLDEILHSYIELHKAEDEIVSDGFERSTVERVLNLVRIAEFKRKQAAPGIKVTDRAFGTGWRMPIACRKTF